MSRMSESGVSLKQAREHVQRGEVHLLAAGRLRPEEEPDDAIMDSTALHVAALATVAAAHFAAAMAITGILLTDPAEAPDLLAH
jgi:hypothetical protein